MLARQETLVGLHSRKHILPFVLERPSTLHQAHTAMQRDSRSVLMAGGLDLIDRMKNGESVSRVIYLGDISALKVIERDGGKIHIGGLATHADIEHSAILAAALPDLPAIWRMIGNPRVRQAGTIGGNLMSGLPHYDAAPALLALGAEATLSYAGQVLTVDIGALPHYCGGILERVSIAETPALLLMADRSLHPALSLYLVARFADDGKLQNVRVAIGCAYPRPITIDLRLSTNLLDADTTDGVAHAVVANLPPPMEDGLASASYRQRMVEVLLRRLLRRLGAQA